MVIRVVSVGLTKTVFVREGLAVYLNRLGHYARVEWNEIPDPPSRGSAPDQQRALEGELILRQVHQGDHMVLLDERGKDFSSVAWSAWMNKRQSAGTRTLVFVIGGAYGFSPSVRERADEEVRLSAMTFPHDLVRVILAEQLYRCFTILRGEKYHHD